MASPTFRRFALAIACILGLAAPALADEATPQAFLTALYHRYEGKHTRGIDYADRRVLLRYFISSRRWSR